MKKYIAYLEEAGELVEVEFETDIKPIEFLWERYGMSTFIYSVKEVGLNETEVSEKGDN